MRREVLEGCIREVMGGDRSEEIRSNVMKWKNLAREAVVGVLINALMSLLPNFLFGNFNSN